MTSTAYPSLPIIKKLRFWLAFTGGMIGFGYILLLGGYTFRGNYTLQLVGFGIALTLALCWMIWRYFIWRDRLPRTGLEAAIGLGILAILISLAASPDPRQGVWRTGWFIGYALLFYFFLNLLDTDLDRWGLLAAVITVTGLALFQADAETYQWYQSWFAVAGWLNLPPVQYRFTGLLTSSIPLMALANLFVPVVLLVIWRFHRPVVRVLASLWLLVYAIAVPFSSSRGAWLSLAVALGLGGLYWAWQTKPWRVLRIRSRSRIVLVGLAGLVGLGMVAVLGYYFLIIFASHPSHGGDPFGGSGRTVFWANAIKMWQSAPWFGVGPGRFAFDYLRFDQTIPPGFWPAHAHNIFFQALAEFGLAGLAALLFFVGSLFVWSWRMVRRADAQSRSWTVAMLAGLGGLLVQLIFDELSSFMAVMVPAVFLLAWIGSNQEGALPTFRRVSLGWLALPAFVLIGISGWGIWAYQPYSQWLAGASHGEWQQAAQQASISASRDPDFHFYATEAGLLWAWEWKYENDPLGLIRARSYLERALQLESSTSWTWANLAILDAASGELPSAIQHMETAVRLSPNMADFVFDLGKFYEQANLSEMAISSYQKALDLKPDWAGMTFWVETPLRQQSLSLWQSDYVPPNPGPPALWQQAQSAIQVGQLDSAAQLLAEARLLNEPEIDIARTQLQLAQARDDSSAIQAAKDQIQHLIDLDQMVMDPVVSFIYPSFLANLDGTGIMAVPGLMVDIRMPSNK